MDRIRGFVPTLLLALIASTSSAADDAFKPVRLSSKITDVQPMTGIVLWTTNDKTTSAPIQLEFTYLPYSLVVTGKDEYDWAPFEKVLDDVASRKHQAVIRWHDTYVGKPTGVPKYITALSSYRGVRALSEKKQTEFPDWSHPELQRATLAFFTEFARRYDGDRRLAFLQVGFGLWAEYHIYDGPFQLGKTFPSHEYQAKFARHLAGTFQKTPWMISVDAASDDAPYTKDPELMKLSFGLFDDSFNHAKHDEVNKLDWDKIGRERWRTSPIGGEFSFYETRDQTMALAPKGPHGKPFADHARDYHLTFILGDAQPDHQKPDVIRKAGLSCGYQFEVTRCESSTDQTRVTVRNKGIAPIYYDAHPAVGAVRSSTSLKGLLPGEDRTCEIPAGLGSQTLTIECDHLVEGQRIQFDADLK
jgi:hypothetical protein